MLQARGDECRLAFFNQIVAVTFYFWIEQFFNVDLNFSRLRVLLDISLWLLRYFHF